MDIWMSRAIPSSLSIEARWAVAAVSWVTYVDSECCISSNESRRRHISSLCLILGSSVSKLPLAISSAEFASLTRGLVVLWMLTLHTIIITITARLMKNSMRKPRSTPGRATDLTGTTIPMDQPVLLSGP